MRPFSIGKRWSIVHIFVVSLFISFLSSASMALDLVVEAESLVLEGAVIRSNNAGFSGEGYVDYTSAENGSITWTFDSDTDQTVQLDVRYALASANRTLAVEVNGVQMELVDFLSSGGWATVGKLSRLNSQ